VWGGSGQDPGTTSWHPADSGPLKAACAIEFSDYLIPHAYRAFGIMGIGPSQNADGQKMMRTIALSGKPHSPNR
jgi:hypothetical protein